MEKVIGNIDKVTRILFQKGVKTFNLDVLSRNEINQIENFNYLNVAFISYKLTMWDLMLFSGCHTRANVLEKKTVLVSRRIYW